MRFGALLACGMGFAWSAEFGASPRQDTALWHRIYVSGYRAERVYDALPCRGISDPCKVYEFRYAADHLSGSERKAYVQTDIATRTLWITVQGTNNAVDAAVDIDHSLLPPNDTIAWAVHEGFWNAALRLFQAMEPDLFQAMKPELSPKSEGYSIRLAGHSLGGAVAALLSELLLAKGYDVRGCITFGQPKVTNAPGAAGPKRMDAIEYIRVVNRHDIVPTLPPADIFAVAGRAARIGGGKEDPRKSWSASDAFRHFGTGLRLGKTGTFAWQQGRADSADESIDPLGSSTNDHHVYNYVNKIEAVLPKSIPLLPRPKHPSYTCMETDIFIRQVTSEQFKIKARSDCSQPVRIGGYALASTQAAGAPLTDPLLRLDTDPDASESDLAFNPLSGIVEGGGWARIGYQSADTNCHPPLQGTRYVRALNQHGLRFRFGLGTSPREWSPTPEWSLSASSLWLAWLRGTADFTFSALKPVDRQAWRGLLKEDVGPLDPFQDEGRRFEGGFAIQAYPSPNPIIPAVQIGWAWRSLPGGDSQGVVLYPRASMNVEWDLPRWNPYLDAHLRAGLARSSELSGSATAGKGAYLADGILAPEVRFHFPWNEDAAMALRATSETTAWEKDPFGPALWSIGLFFDLDLAAAGRIFGFSN